MRALSALRMWKMVALYAGKSEKYYVVVKEIEDDDDSFDFDDDIKQVRSIVRQMQVFL